MPNAVICSHSDYSSIEMRDIHIEQGLSNMLGLFQCLQGNGTPHKLAHVMISWPKLSGSSKPILEFPSIPLSHLLPMTWVPNLRDFMCTHNLAIALASPGIVPLQREGNIYLMDAALQLYTKCRHNKSHQRMQANTQCTAP